MTGLVTALLAGLAGVAALGVGPAHATAAHASPTRAVATSARPSSAVAAARATAGDPLAVTIDRLTPSALTDVGTTAAGTPRRSPDVVLAGRVANVSSDPWSDLTVYLTVSARPFTTQEALAAAVASDPAADVADRVVDPDLYVTVRDLAPGRSAGFRLRVPRDRLPISGEAGVYWVGVHVLGTGAEGRVDGADGRARTFLPLVPRDTPATPLALGLQFRNHTVRAGDGSLEFLPGWQKELGSDGRFGRLLGLGSSAGDYPVSWVVDPAVLEAADSVSHGNPAIDVRDGVAAADSSSGNGSGNGSAARPPAIGAGADPSEPGADTDEARTAASWLTGFTAQAQRRRVLAVPYGDVDAASAGRFGQADLVTRGLAQSRRLLEDLQIGSSPVVVPRTGTLSEEGFAAVGDDVPVVLDRLAAADVATVPDVRRSRPDGGSVLLTDPTLTAGGPAPGERRSALALRQRLLAQAALHALAGDTSPLVTLLPPLWDPGPRWRGSRFFAGLRQPWLSPVPLDSLLGGPDTPPLLDPASGVRYGPAAVAAELPGSLVAATAALVDASTTLGSVLTSNTLVEDRVVRQALLSASTYSRVRPGLAGDRARETTALVESWLAKVVVRGPSFVTLSSGTGSLPVTLVNGLDQPVTVGLDASVSGTGLDLALPEPRVLAPRQRDAILIDASATDIGIHQVVIHPSSTEGRQVGTPLELSIRASQVARVLWFIMGGGAAVLFAAIAVRILRRVRRRGEA